MAYFLRFTETAERDLERNTSLLDVSGMNEATTLDGLCGYSFCDSEDIDYNMLSEEEILSKVNMYKNNSWYSDRGDAVLFEGDYVESNPNGEGVIFTAESIYKIF